MWTPSLEKASQRGNGSLISMSTLPKLEMIRQRLSTQSIGMYMAYSCAIYRSTNTFNAGMASWRRPWATCENGVRSQPGRGLLRIGQEVGQLTGHCYFPAGLQYQRPEELWFQSDQYVLVLLAVSHSSSLNLICGAVVFLERLQSYASLPSDHIKLLGDVYQLSGTPNAEIRLRFYEVALSDPNSAATKTFAQEAAKWVVGDDGTGIIKGRMKFCRPVFKAVFSIDPKMAVSAFLKHKNSFHPIARKLLEKVRCILVFVCNSSVYADSWFHRISGLTTDTCHPLWSAINLSIPTACQPKWDHAKYTPL